MPDSALPGAVTIDDFGRIDIRAGTVVAAAMAEGVRKPSLALEIDFGPDIGVRTSIAQITDHYDPAALVGRQVAAVVNLPSRRIGPLRSDVLTLGFADAGGAVVLIAPDRPVPNGARLF